MLTKILSSVLVLIEVLRKITVPVVVLWAGLLLGTAFSETISGRVVGVADGDTLTVLDGSKQQHKIRLDGIDAPEKAQPFGQRSKQSLSDLAYNRHVQVETHKSDRYGRVVGKVLLDGTDLNLVQINRGLAWHYKVYAHEQTREDRARYAAAEEVARSERRGLWRDAEPTPPWDWRKNAKGSKFNPLIMIDNRGGLICLLRHSTC